MRTEIRLALSILLLAIVTRSTILLIDYMVNRPAVLSIVNDSNWYNILLIEVSLFKINSSFWILCTILVIDRKLRKRAAFINIIRSWTKYRTVLLLAGGFGIGILLRTLFFIINGELPVSSRVCWTMISLLFKYPIYVLFPYCFVIAVAEESLWRGCYANLMRQSWGMGKALFFGSLMFAFWHFTGTISPDIPHIVDLTTGGILLTAAYFCYDSLALPIGLHWGINMVALAVGGEPIFKIPSLILVPHQRFGFLTWHVFASYTVNLAAAFVMVCYAKKKGRWQKLPDQPESLPAG